MKKIMSIVLIITICVIGCFITKEVNAINIQPQYDASYNNNKGIFYANGNSIIINKNTAGDTVVYWEGGSQVVPSTVSIIGGGKGESYFEESNITMEDGTVSFIYGGGISLENEKISEVGKSNVIINNGTVLETVYGGGLIYSQVNDANVTINDGIVAAITGGGGASVNISGVSYSAGTADDAINSKNRTINAKIIINGGKIDSTPSNYGLVYGGGQGYSYTENTSLVINNGDMSKAYVTSGGSNGYTGNAKTEIKGGKINIFQTVNRGQLKTANILIDGGQIENAYLGGEVDPQVTGKVDNVEFNIIGGITNNLVSGNSDGKEINVDQNQYKLVEVEGTVVNNAVTGITTTITYTFEIQDKDISINTNQTKILDTIIKTEPVGYEKLFKNLQIQWNSENNEIATVSNKGEVTGVNVGDTVITAKLLDKQDSIQVTVTDNSMFFTVVIVVLIILLLLLIAIVLLAINI